MKKTQSYKSARTLFIFSFLLITNIIALPKTLIAQTNNDSTIISQQNKLIELMNGVEKKSKGKVKFALSMGWRHIVDSKKSNSLYEATIDPADSTLQLDQKNRGAFLLSGVISIYPFQKSSSFSWLGFIANINLAEFSGQNPELSFNKSIEGGYGIAASLNNFLAIGITYEKVLSRRPKDFVIAKKGQKITDTNGQIKTSLDPTETTFFIQDNFNAISIKLIYTFK